jgi:hypothetical protein
MQTAISNSSILKKGKKEEMNASRGREQGVGIASPKRQKRRKILNNTSFLVPTGDLQRGQAPGALRLKQFLKHAYVDQVHMPIGVQVEHGAIQAEAAATHVQAVRQERPVIGIQIAVTVRIPENG